MAAFQTPGFLFCAAQQFLPEPLSASGLGRDHHGRRGALPAAGLAEQPGLPARQALSAHGAVGAGQVRAGQVRELVADRQHREPRARHAALLGVDQPDREHAVAGLGRAGELVGQRGRERRRIYFMCGSIWCLAMTALGA